jgi:hypothetical protein
MGRHPQHVCSRVGGRGRHRALRCHGVAVRARRRVRAVPDLQQRSLALRTAPRSDRSRLPFHVRRPDARSKDAAVTSTLGKEPGSAQSPTRGEKHAGGLVRGSSVATWSQRPASVHSLASPSAGCVSCSELPSSTWIETSSPSPSAPAPRSRTCVVTRWNSWGRTECSRSYSHDSTMSGSSASRGPGRST